MQAGEFCWVELATLDVAKAKDFYGKIFGWQFRDIEVDKDMTYTLIKTKDKEQEFGGIWRIPTERKDQIPPHWMAYILVDNLKATLDQAKQAGAQVIKDILAIGDMGSLAIIQDPVGAHIALWETKEKK